MLATTVVSVGTNVKLKKVDIQKLKIILIIMYDYNNPTKCRYVI